MADDKEKAEKAEKTVKADLKRTYGKAGKFYGPGEGVEVPESLAYSLGVHPDQQKAKPGPKAAAPAAKK